MQNANKTTFKTNQKALLARIIVNSTIGQTNGTHVAVRSRPRGYNVGSLRGADKALRQLSVPISIVELFITNWRLACCGTVIDTFISLTIRAQSPTKRWW